MTTAALFVLGFICWTVSSLSGGGGSLLLLAGASSVLRTHAVAPVVSIASFFAGAARIGLFWREIEWPLVRWYLPGALAGSVVGSWGFTQIGGTTLRLITALFLISTVFQYRFGRLARSFPMRLPWFIPVSFVSGATSGLTGAGGLLANPFYLNYGIEKERMLATRAVVSLAIQVAKLSAYGTFGALNATVIGEGVAAGLGGAAAVWLSRRWLGLLSMTRFRQFAIAVMLASGSLLLWDQRAALLALLRAL